MAGPARGGSLRRSKALALLIDTAHAADVVPLIETSEVCDAYIAFARGRAALLRSSEREASAWFALAQALVGPNDAPLAARVGFELGCLALEGGQRSTAESIVTWMQAFVPAEHDADLLHLRALIASASGDGDSAVRLYREALSRYATSFSPLTRVIALKNLASTRVDCDPSESLALLRLAIATLETQQLASTSHAAARNALAYALLSIGDLAGAREECQKARAEASASGNARIELYAEFNSAIVDELEGDVDGAKQRLRSIRERSEALGFTDVTGWTQVRQVRLDLLRRDLHGAMQQLASLGPVAATLVDTRDTLLALADHARGRSAIAESTFSRLAATYEAKGDTVTSFVLRLWAGVAADSAGRPAAARRAVARACEIGQKAWLRMSPNWWSGELSQTALRHCPGQVVYVSTWLSSRNWVGCAAAPNVEIVSDATIRVDSLALPQDVWFSRRVGSGVLRRYFRALLAAYPLAVGSGELADRLWPDSDGDRAAANLRTAAKELRRTLREVPGLTVSVQGGRHRLVAAGNVRFALERASTVQHTPSP